MGEQRNLTEENVETLRAQLEEMAKENPDLEYRFFKQGEQEPLDAEPSRKKIFEKLEKIEEDLKKLHVIFGDHVLINGRFTEVP